MENERSFRDWLQAVELCLMEQFGIRVANTRKPSKWYRAKHKARWAPDVTASRAYYDEQNVADGWAWRPQ